MRRMTTTSNNLTNTQEPEDIFADTDDSSGIPQNEELHPIPPVVSPPVYSSSPEPLGSVQPLDASPETFAPQVLTPESTSFETSPSDTTNTENAYTSLAAQPSRFPKRLVLILAIIIGASLLLSGIVWGVYYWYTHRTDVVIDSNNTNTIRTTNTVVPINLNIPDQNSNTSSVNTSTEQFVDSDHDGLSDAEETEVNTNPLKKDTDEDGLSDREEVRVYLTDPRNEDTDEDGYIDGDEVANFYHPNDPDPKKRLFELPQ